jgi:hypothetical protein
MQLLLPKLKNALERRRSKCGSSFSVLGEHGFGRSLGFDRFEGISSLPPNCTCILIVQIKSNSTGPLLLFISY